LLVRLQRVRQLRQLQLMRLLQLIMFCLQPRNQLFSLLSSVLQLVLVEADLPLFVTDFK
jgi:hypothetical protein